MSGHALTRRSFLVGSAGVAAVAAGAGLVSLSVRGEADADAETDKRTEVVHSLCNSCSSSWADACRLFPLSLIHI